MGSPTWHDKTVEERLELVHAVWEGRAVGTWQLAGSPHLERVFPGYSHFEQMKVGDESGSAPHLGAALLGGVGLARGVPALSTARGARLRIPARGGGVSVAVARALGSRGTASRRRGGSRRPCTT